MHGCRILGIGTFFSRASAFGVGIFIKAFQHMGWVSTVLVGKLYEHMSKHCTAGVQAGAGHGALCCHESAFATYESAKRVDISQACARMLYGIRHCVSIWQFEDLAT